MSDAEFAYAPAFAPELEPAVDTEADIEFAPAAELGIAAALDTEFGAELVGDIAFELEAAPADDIALGLEAEFEPEAAPADDTAFGPEAALAGDTAFAAVLGFGASSALAQAVAEREKVKALSDSRKDQFQQRHWRDLAMPERARRLLKWRQKLSMFLRFSIDEVPFSSF
jgi:hypothetical protein